MPLIQPHGNRPAGTEIYPLGTNRVLIIPDLGTSSRSSGEGAKFKRLRNGVSLRITTGKGKLLLVYTGKKFSLREPVTKALGPFFFERRED